MDDKWTKSVDARVRRRIAAHSQSEHVEQDDDGMVTVWQVRLGVPLLLVNVVGVTALALGMVGVDIWFGVWWVWMGLLVVNGWYVAGKWWDAARKIPLDGVVSRRVYWRQGRRRARLVDDSGTVE